MSRDRREPTIHPNAIPCPWCGSQPETIPWHGGGPNKTLIGCSNEYCAVAPQTTAESKSAAVRRWNNMRGTEEGRRRARGLYPKK